MPDLASLTRISEWANHELRCLARETGRWMTKRTGVEALFEDRKGALRLITNEFSCEHLMLRSLPDNFLRSEKGTFAVEVKALSDGRPNVALELYQLLFLRRILPKTWYCLCWIENGRMAGRMIPVSSISPHRIILTDRVRRAWPDELQSLMASWIAEAEWDSLKEVQSSPDGSCDPFALMAKRHVEEFLPIEAWLDLYGGSAFSKRDRISWEGKDNAHRQWKHLPPPNITTGSRMT